MISAILGLSVKKALTDLALDTAKTVAKDQITTAAREIFSSARDCQIPLRPEDQTPLLASLMSLDLSLEEEASLIALLGSEIFTDAIEQYALALASGKNEAVREAKRLIAHLLVTSVGRDGVDLPDTFVEAVFDFLHKEASDAWRVATESGLLTKDWSGFQQARALLEEELRRLSKSVNALDHFTREALQASDPLIQQYRRLLGNQHSKLRPQSLNDNEEAPIQDLYVEPHVLQLVNKEHRRITRRRMCGQLRRAVLLGNPGGGKSTFASKLCHDLCSYKEDALLSRRSITPIPVILREYARHNKENPCSILEYMVLQTRAELQLEVPASVFSLLLVSGRALVVFDGLDELIETSDRVKTRNAVERFSEAYPSTYILVTSREVGYEKAPLDKRYFSIFTLAPFDESQVTEYASRWFNFNRAESPEETRRTVSAFIRESAMVPDIRANPLMLGLLCNLFKRYKFFPKNRPEIYNRCADLLFTKWDAGRSIHVDLPLENKLREVMGYLAHWIYEDENLQAGVPEELLIDRTTRYLSKWRESPEEARTAAELFVSFFKGRAWVFTDTGSDKEQPLYQFTHRTFLEFFTAEHLVKLYFEPRKMHDYLRPRIERREWDVVCQMAYQMKAKSADAADMLIQTLLTDAKGKDRKVRLATYSFIARSLDLLFPTPSVRRMTLIDCLDFVFSESKHFAKSDMEGELVTEILMSFMSSSSDEERINTEELIGSFERAILSASEKSSRDLVLPFLLLNELPIFSPAINRKSVQDESTLSMWAKVQTAILGRFGDEFEKTASYSGDIAAAFWQSSAFGVKQIVEWHGFQPIFTNIDFPFVRWLRQPISDTFMWEILVNNATRPSDSEHRNWIFSEARELSRQVAEASIPLLPRSSGSTFLLGVANLPPAELRWPDDPHLCEAALLCVAISSELVEPSFRSGSINGMLQELKTFVLSPNEPDQRPTAHQIISAHCEDMRNSGLLHAWVEGQARFVNETKRKGKRS